MCPFRRGKKKKYTALKVVAIVFTALPRWREPM